jgi:hypothetical protein
VAAAARELERQGEMKKAEAARALADQAAQEKLAEARMIADAVPVVADTTVRTAGVTNARPWVGEIFDVIRIIEAIAKKEIAVVERQSDGDVELLLDGKVLVTVHKSAVSYQAKRLRREDVGIPGAKGVEEFGMRVSRTSAYADLPVVRKEEGPEW